MRYKRYRTPTVSNTKEPVFDATAPFMVRIRDTRAMIHAHIWDEDWQLPDDYLGSASFAVARCLDEPNAPQLLQLPVVERGSGSEESVRVQTAGEWQAKRPQSLTQILTAPSGKVRLYIYTYTAYGCPAV